MSDIKRRRTRNMVIATVGYIGSVGLGVLIVNQLPDGSIWRWPAALLPILGAIALMVTSVQLQLAGDELSQRAAAIAAVITLLLVSVITISWGILESFAGVPPVNPIWWGAGAMGLWGLVSTLVMRHYA